MRDDAIKILAEKLKKEHISSRSKGNTNLAYIESHHAIREANRAFGCDGWSYSVKNLEKVSDEKNSNGNHVIGFIALVEITVDGLTREDVGFGSGIAKTLADAYEGATKEAVSDAMKRALRTFGDIFGLALYDKERKHVEEEPKQPLRNWVEEIKTAGTVDRLKEIYAEAYAATDGKDRVEVTREKDKRKQYLSGPSPDEDQNI